MAADLKPVRNGSTKPVDLEGGRPLAPGEKATVDVSLPSHAALLDEGVLVESAEQKKQSRRKPTTNTKKEK